jgi:hypothetical protein
VRAGGSDNSSGFGRHQFILQLVVRLFDEGEGKEAVWPDVGKTFRGCLALACLRAMGRSSGPLKNGDRVTGKILKKDGATLRE